jgi:glycosyltransferase involved in cell wall biosynthesis
VFREAFPGEHAKIVVVPNGYDPEDFIAPTAQGTTDGAVRIVHAGELYANRDPRPFLDAIRELGSEYGRKTSFQVRFLGRTGDASFDLAGEVATRGLGEAVSIVGQVPHAESIRELMRADILLLLDTPGRSVGVPAKLYEYLGAARPILALAEQDGDLAEVLRESGVPHRVVPPGDSAAIKRAVSELTPSACLADGYLPASRASSRSPFTRENLARRFADVLNGLTGRSAPAMSAKNRADKDSVRIHPAHAVAAGRWDDRPDER